MKRSSLLSVGFFLLSSLAPGAAGAAGRRFGVMVDAGVPDGALASVIYRPWSFLRFSAGAGTNLAAPGVRAGLSLMLGSLSLNADAGHAFEGDMNPLVARIAGQGVDVAALRRVGYDYVNLHAGLEIGRDPVTFYLHVGMSHLRGAIHDADETFSNKERTVTFASDPTVNVWTPSARLGLIIYFMK